MAQQLLEQAAKTVAGTLTKLDEHMTTAAEEAAAAVDPKDRMAARSHHAWLAGKAAAVLGETSRAVARERSHTAKTTLESVVAWARTLDVDQLEQLIEMLQDEIKKEGGLLS